jgi:hypothetical protein
MVVRVARESGLMEKPELKPKPIANPLTGMLNSLWKVHNVKIPETARRV